MCVRNDLEAQRYDGAGRGSLGSRGIVLGEKGGFNGILKGRIGKSGWMPRSGVRNA